MASISYGRFLLVAIAAAVMVGCSGKEVPDPCKLITLEEIRRIAPETTTGDARETAFEGGKIKTCVWTNASGVEQVRLTSKVSDGTPLEPALKSLLRDQVVRVAPVPSIRSDAAAAFYPLGEAEVMSVLVAQHEGVFLELRPVGAGVLGERSQGFLIASTLMKTAIERTTK